jgi:predicted nucleotide-binding protein
MKRQSTIPPRVLEKVLLKSRRRCPMCYQAGDINPQIGNVEHIRPLRAGGTNSFDNLVFVCAKHNRALTNRDIQEQLREVRDELYEFIEREVEIDSVKQPRVFVVHGRDEATKVSIVRFLEEIGLEPFVLDDQPGLGRTAFEVIEEAKAEYAIVLLTPDDYLGEGARARQNVVLELGYFIGRLGRNRVCSLYRPPIELPSDFHGALYIEMDSDGLWRQTLEVELMRAGMLNFETGHPTQGLKRTPDGAA